MIELCQIVPTSGPKAMVGTNMFALFLREPYEDLLDEKVPERLTRLAERIPRFSPDPLDVRWGEGGRMVGLRRSR